VLPWCEQHKMPVMAYSPLGGSGASLLRDPTLARVIARRTTLAAIYQKLTPQANAASLAV
jgi:diketogulonate reductase-like aldo/keto reductase